MTIITPKIHIIEDLKIKMLIDMNILMFKNIIMNLSKKLIIINSYQNIKISLMITTKSISQIQHTVFVKKHIIILLQSNLIIVIISSDLSLNHNFLFKFSCCQADAAVYVYIVNHVMLKVYVQNDSNLFLIISQKFCMNQVIKYKAKDCYLVNAEDFILILRFWWFIQQE